MSNPNDSMRGLQTTLNETPVSAGMQGTFDDLNDHIDQYHEDPAAHHQSLRERLELTLAELGAEHPKLSEAMQVAISDLSNAGV